MPADTNLIFTSGRFLSNLSTMGDGVPLNFTTPSVNIGTVGIALAPAMVARLFIPGFTNRSPGSGVGAFTRPFLTVVLQGAEGAPTTEANWVDVATLRSMHPGSTIRPHVPTGSTGVGTPANPIYSNVAVARVSAPYTNYRLSGQYIGSFPDFSAVHGSLRVGHAPVLAELF